MGLPGASLTVEEFANQAKALKNALDKADKAALELPGGPGNQVAQLVGFGVHDGALTAAVSLGVLGAAANVTVNVPGAESTVGNLHTPIRAAEELYREAHRKNPGSFAVVSWLGYRAPAGWEAGIGDKARDGAQNLADFLDGIHDSRPGNPPTSFTVMGHSYGSTILSEALKRTRHWIDSFVNYGSAGFENGTVPSDLNVGKIYATEADRDDTAQKGRNLSMWWGRTDPRNIWGIKNFSSEADTSIGTRAVTGHDMYPDADTGGAKGRAGSLSPGTTSLWHIGTIVAKGRLE